MYSVQCTVYTILVLLQFRHILVFVDTKYYSSYYINLSFSYVKLTYAIWLLEYMRAQIGGSCMLYIS